MLETDLRKPRLARSLGIDAKIGLSDYLSFKAKEEDIIAHTKDPYLDIIPSGPVPPNPAELLGNKRLGELIDSLKISYDYIIIDSPPLGLVADSQLIFKHANVVVYIVRQGFSNKKSLQLINTIYEKNPKLNIGILMNDTKNQNENTYGYGYGYGDDMNPGKRRKKRSFSGRKTSSKVKKKTK